MASALQPGNSRRIVVAVGPSSGFKQQTHLLTYVVLISGHIEMMAAAAVICRADALQRNGAGPHPPADSVRRPPVLAESPSHGLGHLQFEALITTARLSAPGRHRRDPQTFVTAMLDAGVGLRDVQIAARHADYILAAFMACGT
ncbi:hypothetical protein Vau01_047760 [Virgisporangium aurantiacum]|uniref:Uncharacterized protein n=1 Tax=Virgisporangium aurantiacum TaxID=175570 RepID=A0A8J3Z981_9ACTN|nr:hypothetical protein Vau01_047760 [Virgisporangium aurantiacum]